MSGETILVVEDSPISLKLTAAALRAEGYKVHVVSSAEQALSTLRFLTPDLVLADLMLPGMSGLELAGQIRRDSRLRGCAVVALTACVMAGDEQQALQAGCHGYIAKPIEAHELIARIRGYLNDAAEPPAAPAAAVPPESRSAPQRLLLPESEMEDLQRSFLSDGLVHCRQLLTNLGAGMDVAAAGKIVHQWSGTGGLIGFPNISGLARNAENVLRTAPLQMEDLRQCLTKLEKEFSESVVTPVESELPESIARQLANKRIALIGFADVEAERLCAACESVGAKPRLFAADDPADKSPVMDCHAVLIHVRPETIGTRWLSAGFEPPAHLPLIFVGGRKLLFSLEPKVQLRPCDFLVDGWQPEEALMRVSFALTRPAAEHPRAETPAAGSRPATTSVPFRPQPAGPLELVIADDDEAVRTVVQSSLQSYGFRCHLAATGSEALHLIRTIRPRAAVLDVSMPVVNGLEVLSAIRAEKMAVRVLILTARKHENDVLDGFRLGADEYMVKPFSPLELVARLKRLLGE